MPDHSPDPPKLDATARAAVILNASAGGGCNEELAQRIAARFATHGIDADVTLAHGGEEIIGAAQRAVKAGCGIVAAGGGDGTQNAVAGEVLGSAALFGVLPIGTLNHFAKDLGIPLELEAAIDCIAARNAVAVDTGEINGRLFLNNSSLGLYPEAVRRREQHQHRHGRSKWIALFWSALAVLRRYPFLDLSLGADGAQVKRRTPCIFIGNNEYLMEGFGAGARARMQEGLLSVYLVKRVSRLGLLGLALRALAGRLRQARDFEAFKTASLRIDSRHRDLRVSTDGEINRIQTPLNYIIRPASLKVIVPAKLPDA